jgi:dipeptidyl aminopeptidase/acylaminoacyl peptidase
VLVQTPDRVGVRYEPVSLRAADGVDLVAWFMPASGKAHATVLFLHGNAENISTHFLNVAWMPAEGFNVLALDYRGYGGSAGRPSLPGAQLDIDAALTALRARPDVDPRRIVLFGPRSSPHPFSPGRSSGCRRWSSTTTIRRWLASARSARYPWC